MAIRTSVTIAGRTVHLVIGDLLQQPVDAIVNAANSNLAHGGGVAAVIARAAGPALDAESRVIVQRDGTVPTGGAAVTTAGRLPFRGVIHAVGPWHGQGEEEEKLAAASASALLRAHERGWTSVAFPGVSSGIFAVPHEVCARAYVAGIRRHFADVPGSTVGEVRITLFEGPLVGHVERELVAAGA